VSGAGTLTADDIAEAARELGLASPQVPGVEAEGCTPADARMLRQANHGLADENFRLREALSFYADGNHFLISGKDSWDTVSGEPQNYWCDEAGTATVEDGSVAKAALASGPSGVAANSQERGGQDANPAAYERPFQTDDADAACQSVTISNGRGDG
jgi:hypothetical protein